MLKAQASDTHIDSLLERLKLDRLRRILEPIIVGDSVDYDTLDDDYQYATDLGLIFERDCKLTPANPIYGETIMRSEKTFEDGKRQLSGYMDVLGCVEGWLVVFDRRKDVPWESKLTWRPVEEDGQLVHIVCC